MKEESYQRLWLHARKRCAGAVAVRFARGALRRSPHVFALWPAEMRDGQMLGLNLGMYNVSVGASQLHPLHICI